MLKAMTPNRSTALGQPSHTRVMGITIRLDVFTVGQVTKRGGYGGVGWRLEESVQRCEYDQTILYEILRELIKNILRKRI